MIWQSDGQVWNWWMSGERYLPECVVLIVKFGGAIVMVWGCSPFSWFRLEPLVLVNGNMNFEVYVNILNKSTLPTL